MSYLDNMLERVDIQQICKFLLYGTENTPDPHSRKERLDNARRLLINHLQIACSDDFQETLDAVYAYALTAEEVFMELGLQAGATLACQLFPGRKPTEED